MLFACEHLYHANWVRSFDNIRLALVKTEPAFSKNFVRPDAFHDSRF